MQLCTPLPPVDVAKQRPAVRGISMEMDGSGHISMKVDINGHSSIKMNINEITVEKHIMLYFYQAYYYLLRSVDM